MSITPSNNDFKGIGSVSSLTSLINAIPDGLVVVNREGKVTSVNAQTLAMFGYSEPELIGQMVEVLLPERLRKVHPGHRASYFAAPQIRAMGSGLQLFGRRKDGSEMPVSISLNSLETSQGQSSVAIVRDISEAKKAEKAVHETEEQFRMMVEAVKDYAIFMLDRTGHVITWNSGAERIKGFAPHDIVGEHFSRFYPPEDIESGKPDRELEIALKDGRFEEEGWRHRKDGSRFWASVVITPVTSPDGLPQGFVKVTRDITDRLTAERLLLKAKDEAEKANLAKSEFLSRMSHELRTPMNSVLGFAKLLDLQFQDPRIKEASRSILRAGKHLLQMINEVLDLSRIESGDLAVSSEPVEFEGVINQAIGLVQPIADAAGISVEVLGLTCHTAYAQADRQRLLQVLINLLSNAVKYNRQQGRVTLQCFATPHNTVRIEVADTGYGISLEDQELLFQPFQRFGDSGIEGSGLGLALSRRFALLMGGKLGLATSSPLGSTFFIELKMVDSIEQPLVLQEQDSSSWNLLTKRQGTILYIEDNTSNIALLENLFSTCPMISLITVENGTLGIELARKHHPDVILLDLHLPDLMGDIVLERLKSDPETDSIPVVFLSADATNRQITKMISAGAVDYLTKPIDLLRLFQLLNDLLD